MATHPVDPFVEKYLKEWNLEAFIKRFAGNVFFITSKTLLG